MARCKHVSDAVKNETDLPATTAETRTAEWRDDRISNLTPRGYYSWKSDDGTAAISTGVTKRLANAYGNPVVAAANTSPLPRTRKPISVTTRRPPKRPTQNNTARPMKKQKAGGTLDVGHAKATTAGPKLNKRLSGGGTRNSTVGDQSTGTVAAADFKSKYPTEIWRDQGFYTDDYMKLINGHWFKFMPPNPASHYVLGFLYVIIMVFGCSGNFLVIFMYIKLVRVCVCVRAWTSALLFVYCE